MWPFNDDESDDDGCTAHHFPDSAKTTGETETRNERISVYLADESESIPEDVVWESNKSIASPPNAHELEFFESRDLTRVKKRREKQCLHDGCFETKDWWSDAGWLDIERGEFHEDPLDHFVDIEVDV